MLKPCNALMVHSGIRQLLMSWLHIRDLLRVTQCQDWFFADLILQGVRGSGHSLAVRPKGYVV